VISDQFPQLRDDRHGPEPCPYRVHFFHMSVLIFASGAYDSI